ncbi:MULTISPECIES: GDSL-type esterase/lipase family protein [Helicobacter]|uniref:Putative periplasmic protein n=2 Tax=Helicobacter typhlonius TaxID=76936 RepID=A0A099UDN0_9HELI|nr:MULTISPECIES: GDSL-type esterase/lipase family protein [Helicobacter]TLD78262.1 hypothetical protein LS75_006535 [Helicobacter typhlonius]TLD87660.1 hypothetical protein LS67_006305 [Helicobacter sp. MIT 03-1616]CUU38998.1 Putative periplasmic protein [Helicobacter typhlonius]HCD72997.1 hypothetical protein [Helicobacter sp.]
MKTSTLFVILLAGVVFANGADYPLKAIGIALGNPKQTTIPNESKKLLSSTSGIKNYGENLSPTFKSKLKTKQDLTIRILGDSHIAGDFMSHRLRGLLFLQYSFGFVYPLYPKYHQHIGLQYESENFEILNSHLNESSEYPLGGIMAKPTTLPASIKLTPKNNANASLSKIIFAAPNKKKALMIEDSANQKFVINAKNPNAWQMISLNLQYPVTLHALNENVLLGGFAIIHDEGQDNIVENLGINGARSDLWLKWDKELLMQQMRILPADLYVLCYGSNDALYDNFDENTFMKNYGNLIDSIREANPQAQILLLAPPPVVKKVSNATKRKKAVYRTTKNAKAVSAAISKLAIQKHTLLFSMEDFINQSGGKAQWERANLAKPDVHLLPNGYKLIADKLYYELRKLE